MDPQQNFFGGIKRVIGSTAAIVVLGSMFLLLLGSMRGDSATFDETAHIAAGASYIKELDYRLNPEHPPLLKALAALFGELFVDSHFPTDTAAWQEFNQNRWWLQFDQGRAYLYESGNNPDSIIFWYRIPTLLLSILLGLLLYFWSYKRFGITTALFALLFYAFSPTVLAHARYVTTDIAAAFGFFIGLIAFLRFLEYPTTKNIGVAGLVFAIAQLLKFSLIMLIPIYGILIIVWVYSRSDIVFRERIKLFGILAGKTILIGLIGIAFIWAVYTPFVWNYPTDRQLSDAASQLSTNRARALVQFDLALIQNPITKPLGQYFLGVLMANQRAAGGNTAYFLGTVSSEGSYIYFPLLYILKEHLVLHILTLLVLGSAFWRWRTTRQTVRLDKWIQKHFVEVSMLTIIAVYWLISIIAPLNIGVRHVLPTFPFIYILVAKGISAWLYESTQLRALALRYVLLVVLFLWVIGSMLIVYPHYLSYYNALAGGTSNGYTIATDSNYDWGQDFYRLGEFIKENNIEHIAVDYFGGANPQYYLGDIYEPWWSAKGPPSGWFAISANMLQGAHAEIGPGFSRNPEDSYEWLREKEPVARAGKSIFIYSFSL